MVGQSLCGGRSNDPWPYFSRPSAHARSDSGRHFGQGGRRSRRADHMANYFHRRSAITPARIAIEFNSVMHMIGNPILFVAVVLPLCLLPVSVSGVQTSAAPLLTIPVLVLWTAWDVMIGLGYRCYLHSLLFAASAIASHVNILSVWVTAVGLFVLGWALQILGHRLFEGDRQLSRQSRSDAD